MNNAAMQGDIGTAQAMNLHSDRPIEPSQADEPGEEDIVERIFEAVVEQRLPPGTKLSESALCEAFGVGRMRIRRSLLLLSSREVAALPGMTPKAVTQLRAALATRGKAFADER